MIKKMGTEDVDKVVSIHLASFPEFFLSFLGHSFLSIYYSGISSVPEGICFVDMNSSGITGFVVGTSNPRRFYSRLLRSKWIKFSIASLGAICRKPSIIKRLVRAFFHPSQNPVGDDVAGLFSIGVLPELQGTGIGSKLVQKFLKEAEERGCKRVFLTTDRDYNDSVNAFYQKLGFQLKRQYMTPEERSMNEYTIDISFIHP